VDPGERPGRHPALFSEQTEAQGAEKKKNTLDQAAHLSPGLVDHSQTLTHAPSSEGLDLPLL